MAHIKTDDWSFDGVGQGDVYRNRSMYDIQSVTADQLQKGQLDYPCPICGGDHAPESHRTPLDVRKAYDLPMSWGDQEGVTYPPNKYGASNWVEALHDNPIPQTPRMTLESEDRLGSRFTQQVMGLEETDPDPVVTRPKTEQSTLGFNWGRTIQQFNPASIPWGSGHPYYPGGA